MKVFLVKLYFTGTLGMLCIISFAHTKMISFGEDPPDSKVMSSIN